MLLRVLLAILRALLLDIRGQMMTMETLLAVFKLAFQYLKRVNDLWALLLLRLQVIYLLHELNNLFLSLLKHLL